MATIDKRELKGYVRFDGQGRIVPSSLILRKKMPKVGKWIEVPAYLCCNPTTTTTTTYSCAQYVALIGRETDVLSYTDCDGKFVIVEIVGSAQQSFCARSGSAIITGTGTIIPLGSCTCTALFGMLLGEADTAQGACTAFGDSGFVYTDSDDFSVATVLYYSQGCVNPGNNYFSDGIIVRECVDGVLGASALCEPVSDIRLKENIVPTGAKIGIFDEYSWTWNSTAKALKLDHYPTTGVIAQEVMETRPDAVTFNNNIGYFRVNYSKLKN